jgi:tetratricopeptide (TPR) repeat protein
MFLKILARGWVLYLACALVIVFSINPRRANVKILNYYQDSYRYLFDVARQGASPQKERLIEAVKFYKSYNRIFKDDPAGVMSLSYAYYLQREYRKAFELTRKVQKRHPDDIGVQYNLIALCSLLGDQAQVSERLGSFGDYLKHPAGLTVAAAAVVDPAGEVVSAGYRPAFLQDRLRQLAEKKPVDGLFYYLPRR